MVSAYRREIEEALVGAAWGHPLEVHDKISSTNELAMAWARRGAPAGALVVADVQTRGRGRFGREWVAPVGTSILASVILRPALAVDRAPLVTLAFAAAVRDVIAAETGADIRVKWPNDVLSDGRKMAGILTETILSREGISAMVIGFGINVNPPQGTTPGTSMSVVARRAFGRGEVLRKVIDAGSAAVAALIASGPEAVLDALRRHSSVLGQEISLRVGERTISGRAVDIDAEGRLVLDTPEGLYRAVAGEVSMREAGM